MFLVLFAAGVCAAGEAFAQKHPERKHIRSGNKDYEALEYGRAESKYRGAMMKDEGSFEAAFNLGDALYKQNRYEEAAGTWGRLAEHPGITAGQRAKAFYNLGNSQFQQHKLKEALDSYKKSLICNPDDLQAKFNLAYVQKLLDQQDENKDNNNKDNEQDKNQDQDKDKNQDNDQQEGGGENDERNDQSDRDQQEQPEEQPREIAISPEDAQQMLEAIQSQEDKTREKMDEKKKVGVAASGKNW